MRVLNFASYFFPNGTILKSYPEAICLDYLISSGLDSRTRWLTPTSTLSHTPIPIKDNPVWFLYHFIMHLHVYVQSYETCCQSRSKVLSLYSTATQNHWRWGLALGKNPNALSIPICWYLKNAKVCITPNANPKICVTPNAKTPTRVSGI